MDKLESLIYFIEIVAFPKCGLCPPMPDLTGFILG